MEHARYRLEVATDLVCDIKRMEREAEGVENESTRGKKISPLQVKEMIHSFNLFDRNGDKSLDTRELASVFRALGQNPTEAQLEKIVRDVDENENGTIEEDEFVALLIQNMQSREEVERDLHEAFEAFDRNGDGRIDKTELMRVLRMTGDTLTEDEADEMIALMGRKGDGLVDINEFTRFLCKDLPEVKEDTCSGESRARKTTPQNFVKR